MTKIILICAHCNNPFSVWPSRKRKYCTRSCYENWQASRRVSLICETCGNQYETIAFWANAPDGRKSRYCSKKCMNQGISKKRTGEGNPLWVDKIQKTCPVCKKVFKVTPGSPILACCSNECRGKQFSQTYRRENHWLWKGGKPIDYGPDWQRVAAKIRKRDEYTCQHCGKKRKGSRHQKALNVHHITKIREFNGDYQTANHPSNLVTLCNPCHAKVESGIISVQRTLL